MYVNQTLKFQNMHDENENYMNGCNPQNIRQYQNIR